MDIARWVGMGIGAAVLYAVLREARPEMAAVLSLAAGAVLMLGVLGGVQEVTAAMRSLSGRVGLEGTYVSTLLRVIGIAYLAQFGAQACRDAGAGGIADKVELCGKVAVLSIAAPVVVSLMDVVTGVLV